MKAFDRFMLHFSTMLGGLILGCLVIKATESMAVVAFIFAVVALTLACFLSWEEE